MELEEELKVVGNSLKSLEVSEEKVLLNFFLVLKMNFRTDNQFTDDSIFVQANQRVVEFKRQLKTLTVKLKEAEARAEFAEKTVKKLQKEVDRLEGQFVAFAVNHFYLILQNFQKSVHKLVYDFNKASLVILVKSK